MKIKSLVPILVCLLTFAVVMPVQATTYTVTLTLIRDQDTLWTRMLELEVPDTTVNLTIPQGLYDFIVTIFGTDTFIMPFNVTLGQFILSVESDPTGLTIIFQPMSPGDVNGDRIVDVIDIIGVAVHFGETPETPNYDLFLDVNTDFEIDIFDLLDVATNFGETY